MPTGLAAPRRLAKTATMAAAMAAVIAAAVALPRPAVAQQVAVIVNGAPITTYDIEQRMKFNMLAHKPQTRQEAIQELIDDKLKVQIGERYKLEVTDTQVDSQYAAIGQRMHQTPQQLTAQLAQAGVDAQTLKDKLRADISWQQIVRGKFQSALQVTDKVVKEKTGSDQKETGSEYTLVPVLFIVPSGSSAAAIDSRKREAEQLRARFENCRDGTAFARALRDVAIREPIVKSSTDLAPEYRKMLDELDVGKLTSPDVTQQGVQMFALCQRKQKEVDAADTKKVRDQMFAQQFEAKSKQYLEVLRKGAMIEVK